MMGVRNEKLVGLAMIALLAGVTAGAQFREDSGKSLGKLTTHGNLIVLELGEDALGRPNLFNLAHHCWGI